MNFKGMTPQQAADWICDNDIRRITITPACQHFSNEGLERARAHTLPFLIERILKQNTAAG